MNGLSVTIAAWTEIPVSGGHRSTERIAKRLLAPPAACLALLATTGAVSADETGGTLPSWNDTRSKHAIVAFVERVTTEGSADYVPPAERIAVFDNDGTLWSEQPAYFQLFFAIDRIKAMAADHPEWKDRQPFAAVLDGDVKALAASGDKGILQLVMASHAGMTEREFAGTVRDWLATATHPDTGRPYTEMVFQPMLELLEYLRAHDFRVFIVSGGGIDFLRVFCERVYGIPPENVVGSSIKAAFEMRDGKPVLVKQPEILLVDDKEGKPVGIHQFIGRRPILAFGNSDGDLQMLQYTTIPRGDDDTTPRLGLIIHHDDAEREFAYDRDSHVGRLDQALDEAPRRGWVVVSMKNDWKTVFADPHLKGTR